MPDRRQLLDIISGRRNDLAARAVRGGLGLLTPLYRLVIAIRNRRFDRAIASEDTSIIRRVNVPVISVGNLTTGGTGKSPMVIYLVQKLLLTGLKVVIVSRGYHGKNVASGNKTSGDNPSGNENPENGGSPLPRKNDEALEMEARLPNVPHLQDPDRFRMSQIATGQLAADIIVLDDGFQHRQLHRDLDIVLVDATEPFGFERLLPRGLLREPLSSFQRADVIVITRCNLVAGEQIDRIAAAIGVHAPDVPVTLSETHIRSLIQADGARKSLTQIENERVFAFCGIGNPAGFFETLPNNQLQVVGQRHYPDHHHFEREDLQQVGQAAIRAGATMLICTHKDLVKIDPEWFAEIPVYALLIDMGFRSGADLLDERIRTVIEQAG